MNAFQLPEHETDWRYHAATLVCYPLLLMVLAVWVDHPVFLLALLTATLISLGVSGGLDTYGRLLRYGWWLLLLVFVLNVLINKNGLTVLWTGGPKLWVFGKLRITLESMVYAGAMIVRFAVILGSTALYMHHVSGDRALGLFARFAGKSAVVAMLTTRLIPYLGTQATAVGDVLRTRGVRLEEGKLLTRLRKRGPMLNVLLVSSLEGSWQVAEAMEARGFGLGRRTAYTRERWSGRDALIWLLLMLTVGLASWLSVTDAWTFSYYPRRGAWLADGIWTLLGALLLGGLLAAPALLMKRRTK